MGFSAGWAIRDAWAKAAADAHVKVYFPSEYGRLAESFRVVQKEYGLTAVSLVIMRCGTWNMSSTRKCRTTSNTRTKLGEIA